MPDRHYRFLVAYGCRGCRNRWWEGALRRPRYWLCPTCGAPGEVALYERLTATSMAAAKAFVVFGKLPDGGRL